MSKYDSFVVGLDLGLFDGGKNSDNLPKRNYI